MQKSASMLLLMVAALGGCAEVDRAIDRYTTHYQDAEGGPDFEPADAFGAVPAGLPEGVYAGDTSPAPQNTSCPRDNVGTLDVGHGQVRYSDPANGMIEGPIGPGGQVALDRAGIRLQGRLAGGRFVGTVSGGACAYRLAFRRGGVPTAVALAPPAPLARPPVAPMPPSFAPPAIPPVAPPAAPAPPASARPTPPVQVAEAQQDDQSDRFDTVLVRLRRRRYAHHAADPVTTTDSASAPSPQDRQAEADRAVQAALGSAGTAAPASDAHSPAARANRLLAQGHISSARPLYERAAAGGDAAAATALGKTYDPLFLANMHANGMRADPALAAAWYKQGAALGDPRAASRLSSLQAMQKQ